MEFCQRQTKWNESDSMVTHLFREFIFATIVCISTAFERFLRRIFSRNLNLIPLRDSSKFRRSGTSSKIDQICSRLDSDATFQAMVEASLKLLDVLLSRVPLSWISLRILPLLETSGRRKLRKNTSINRLIIRQLVT